MCAPSVIDSVRRTVSRRELFGAIGGATLAAAKRYPAAGSGAILLIVTGSNAEPLI